MFSWLKRKPRPLRAWPPLDLEALHRRMDSLAMPCVAIALGPAHEIPDAPGSYFGGGPWLPAGAEWPKNLEGKPLTFVVQIDLADVQAKAPVPDLPPKGLIQIYIDFENWPGTDADDEGWALVHTPAFDASKGRFQAGESYPKLLRKIEFSPGRDWPHEEGFPDLSPAEDEAWAKRRNENGTIHKLLGFADPVQNDPAEEAWMSDPRLLLQIDSDGQLDVSWGDWGSLYIYVSAEDLAAADFSEASIVAQSH